MVQKLLTFFALVVVCHLSFGQQVHERDFGTYRLRSSIAPSDSLAAETAASLNIPRKPDVAVLNVTLLRSVGAELSTVPGRISAVATNLIGAPRSIELVKTQNGGWVSYTGFFRFVPNEVLDFQIRARPDGGNLLEMNYRETLWAPAKAPAP